MAENWRNYAVTFLKGMAMGTADIVPGVSGGTIAFITGIYERFIGGIAYVADIFSLKNANELFNIKKFTKKIRAVDFALFVPLLLGISAAFLMLSSIIHHLLETEVVLTYAFFFGLIFASALFLYHRLKRFNASTALFCIVGLVIGYFIAGLDALAATESLVVLFISAAFAIIAMILPGVSGAFILVLLNQYKHVLSVVKNLEWAGILTFFLGAIWGLFTFSGVLDKLLKKYRTETMGFLIGIMLGSLRLPYLTMVHSSYGMADIPKICVVTGLGFLSVVLIEKMA